MAEFVITAPDGKKYKVTGATKDGALAALKKQLGGRSVGEKALRVAELASRGFMDSAAETLGAIPEASSWIMRNLGLTDTPAGTFTNAIKSGSNAAQRTVSAPINELLGRQGPEMRPETTLERGAYGAGRGAADAASIMLPAAAVARTARAGGVTANVARSLTAQPVMQAVSGATGGAVGEATDNPLLGVLAALAVPASASAIRRLITPNPSQLSNEAQRLAGVAGQEGIQLTAGQRTGSKALQTTESVFKNLPFTGGPQNAIDDAQRAAFNRAVLERAGINADVATPDVLDAAARHLGQQFEQISAQTTVNLDNQFLTDLQGAATRYATKLPTNTRPIFQSYVDDILNTGNQMQGAVYQQTRSDLTRQAKTLSNSDPGLSNALRGIRNALDEAANRSIPQPLQDAWQTTRRQYANLKAILGSMSRPSAGAAEGNISGANLWQSVRAGQTKDQFARGAGELNNLARIGQTFIKDQVPNSGTPQRTFIQNLLQGGPAGVGIGVAAMGEPVAGAAVAAGSLGMPRLIQSIMNSAAGQRYLSNQLLPGAGPANAGLLSAVLAGRTKEGLLGPR